MKKLLGLLVGVMLLVGVVPAHADSFTVLGHRCDTWSHNGNDYKICLEYWARTSTPYDVRGLVDSVGDTSHAKATVDFVYLWKNNGEERVAGTDCNCTFAKNATWSVFTPPVDTVGCTSWGTHPYYHTEAQYRLTWADGAVGPWRDVNSYSVACYL